MPQSPGYRELVLHSCFHSDDALFLTLYSECWFLSNYWQAPDLIYPGDVFCSSEL